jgi:hypothetical protein
MTALEELVRAAMGYGVMMALEGKAELIGKLQQLDAHSSLADALTSDAEKFLETRVDLADAVTVEILAALSGDA